ncbi:MAG: glutamine synthetase family protein [Kiloniellaceae bacterium]
MTLLPPPGVSLSDATDFLSTYPQVDAVDVVLTDCHGIGRGKTIRRHELEALYTAGRAMPGSLFGQDVAGDDVEATGLVTNDGGSDKRCWPLPGTLGFQPHSGRGQVLVSMYEAGGAPFDAEPRHALMRQIDRAHAAGFFPVGAFELEFYLIDRERDGEGRYRPARYALTGRRPKAHNTMSVDELDEMSPFFEAVYEGARHLDLPLESLISEYAVGQFELTIRHRELARAADDVIVGKRLIRSVARRFGMEACFMAKPFGRQAGNGMHLHLSLADAAGGNLFADTGESTLNPLLLHAIAGVRATLGDSMLVLAPFLNSWRRFAATVYSPANDAWGLDNRTTAIRVPETAAKARHFEQRVAGVDANPYLVAAVTLAGVLDGIAAKADPGPPNDGRLADSRLGQGLPRSWLDAIETLERSAFARQALGETLHRAFVAVKHAEWERFSQEVSEAEWDLYGFVV